MIGRALFFSLIVTVCFNQASADLVLNGTLTITGQVNVQPILVRNSDGSNPAEYFGSAPQQSTITSLINQVWAQAGIQISFLAPNLWNNSFANIGTPGSNSPRPQMDLNTIVASGDLAGVGNSNPFTIDRYFVEIAAGFSDVGENTANGLAFVNGNGITQHVGDNLVSFLTGQELIAKVVSHEIGHNLGLFHLEELQNLMQAGGALNDARLNAAQITTARGSLFVVAVPEPTSLALVLCVLVGISFGRNRFATRKVKSS